MILLLTLLILVHVTLLSKLIFVPYPELFIYPYLTKIGLVPYKDILDQHFPGIMFFPINLATLGIDTPSEMRWIQYLLVIACHLLLFLISNRFIKIRKLVFLPNLLYLIWQPFLEGYVLWIDSFVAPVLLAVCYFSLSFESNKERLNLFYSGLLLGVAILFKQVAIPLAIGYLIYLWFEYRQLKYIKYLALGLSIPALYLVYFVLSNGIWSDFFYWTATFNLTIFADMGRKFATVGELVKITPIFGLPLAGLLYIYLRLKNKFFSRIVELLAIFFVGSLAFVYARFDYVHLQPSLVFAVLILSYLLSLLKRRQWAVTVVIIFSSVLIITHNYRGHLGNNVVFYGEVEKAVANLVLEHVTTGERVFAFGTLPHIYQMTRTIPPGNIFVFQFHWFMNVAEDRILDGIVTNPPKVVIRDKTASVAGVNLSEYASQINDHVDKYFHTVNKVENIEIMIPN